MRWLVFGFLMAALPVWADGEKAGEFDYYVLSLSWSPNWCAIEGDAKGSDQCHPRHDHGWILHGLWPQYESGWPAFCRTGHKAPSRMMTNAMADIMGSSGLAWHQWNKHGTCSGLSAEDYYALSRLAYERVARPAVLRKLDRVVKLPATLIEEAFLRDNPGLAPDMVTVTCKRGYVQEVRLCLTRGMEPVACARDTARDCTLSDALLAPVR